MKNNRRLLWQIYPSFLTIIILSLLSVTWYASGSFREFFLDQISADLESRAHLVEEHLKTSEGSLKSYDIDKISKILGKASSTRITVIYPSGVVAGDSEEMPEKMTNHGDRPEIVTALSGSPGKSVRFSGTLGQSMMYVAIPIIIENEIAVVVRTSIPTTSVEHRLLNIKYRIAAGVIFVAFVTAGISLVVSRRISRPIEEMKRGAEKFASGDLTHKLVVPDTEELGRLAVSMNQMSMELYEKIQSETSQKNKLEAVLSSMVEGVIAIDNEGIIISINDAALNIFDGQRDLLLGRDIRETSRNLDLHHYVEEAIVSTTPVRGDVTLHTGSPVILHTHSSPLKDSHDNRIGTLIVLNNVTTLRNLENMRRDFAANVSHEVKTPLTAIKGFVETIQHSRDDQEKTERFLGIIEKNVNRLIFIIDDLMNLSKIEQNNEREGISLSTEELLPVIKSALQACGETVSSKQIEVDLECKSELAAMIDSRLLEQALINIVDNAVKYSDEKSTIRLWAEETDDEVIINVRDRGIGIPEDHFERLFERFYRVDKARSRKLGGTGLGLAIVKHIMEAHGGKVTVKSTPEEGSTFSLHIPVKQG